VSKPFEPRIHIEPEWERDILDLSDPATVERMAAAWLKHRADRSWGPHTCHPSVCSRAILAALREPLP